MTDIDDVSAVFTGRIELRDGRAVIEIPEREIKLGALDASETYQVAVLPSNGTSQESEDGVRRVEDLPREDRSAAPVEKGELIEVEIEDVGEKGDGIARVGPGFVVFVSDTDIGDRVTAEVEEVRESFAFADVVEGEPITAGSTSRRTN